MYCKYKDYIAHLELSKNTKVVCFCSTLRELVCIGLWVISSTADDCMSVISRSVDHQVSLHHQHLLQQLYNQLFICLLICLLFFCVSHSLSPPQYLFSPLLPSLQGGVTSCQEEREVEWEEKRGRIEQRAKSHSHLPRPNCSSQVGEHHHPAVGLWLILAIGQKPRDMSKTLTTRREHFCVM